MFDLPPELRDDNWAHPSPIRVASIREAHIARYAPVDPVATAAALPYRLSRVLLIACDQWLGWGYPVWSIAGVTDWSRPEVLAIGKALARRDLAEVQDPDGVPWIKPTATGRALADLILSWRS
ncbi:hypothetical protein SAMN05216360_103106 [Methylobacterium phyllostachyos]|uniref:Uncharacterized protein n=1 Tax=Methylobacterium phyllostachyos TaxID=582672 RepID=A0A1G9V8X8_9HYPH|nr:hypothetical protein [Methylobacterium phyllostachyos]SDM68516.1 hypothetical protein SAMN05216360_103106 [Methylobacterium phyllostachyos]